MLNHRKRRPTHPGEILRKDLLPETNLTQTKLAERLGVSRRTLNDILHERRPISPDTAHRLARVFNTTPEFWLRLQESVNIWEALQTHKNEYKKIRPLTPGKAA